MSYEGFDVSLSRHLMSGLVQKTRWLWRWLGNVETKVLDAEIEKVDIEAPIYISGLARAGSTILLRVVDTHPETVSHQYRDFPFIYIPYWWEQTLDRQVKGQLEPAERAHKDRLKVTPESPEAMEEVLWMAFFDHLHDLSQSNVLDADTSNEEFESFYRDHIRKLLHVRDGSRYAAKGNYNVTRLEYILEMFPDARLIVPIRHPRAHIGSSQKQHRLFCNGTEQHPRALDHLKRVGHYEFGPHRRPINTGDTEHTESIQKLWEEGREVRGWARYWAQIYGFVADRLEASEALAEATVVVRYEDLCESTSGELERILDFCQLDDGADHIRDKFVEEITAPSYYEQNFDEEQEAAIREETAEVAARFGYGESAATPEVAE
ncbi:MAG: sulfotransferase [Bradymonadaceae bacterium]